MARRISAKSALRVFIRRMNTNNADKNKESGAKQVSAKALMRKLNAGMSEAKMQLDELGGPFDSPGRTEKSSPAKAGYRDTDAGHGGESAPGAGARYSGERPDDFLGGGGRAGDYYEKRSDSSTQERPGRIVYRFRRTSKKELLSSPGMGTYVSSGGKDKKAQAAEIERDSAPTKQFDAVDDQSADLAALMKKYLSEEEYQKYLKRHGGVIPPSTSEFEEAQAEEPALPPEPGTLPEHDKKQLDAETRELSETGDDQGDEIKKRIREAEEYVRSITDKPPARETDEQSEGELDETDVNLMIAFGMEDELANTVGIDKVSQIEEALARDIVQFEDAEKPAKRQPQKEEFEFTSSEQAKGIFRRYKIEYRKLMLRVLCCLVLLVASFLYENISVFGAELPAVLNSEIYPVTNIMFDLQLVVLAGALVWRQLVEGVQALFKLKPLPSSVLWTVLTVTLVYDIAMCFAGLQPDGIKLYGFPAILCVFLALVAEYHNLRREIYSFNIAASKRIKYAIDKVPPEEATLETEAFGEYMPESPSIFRISHTNFIDGFYRRTRTYSKNKSVIGAVIPLVVVVSAIFFVAGYYVTQDAVDALTTAFLTFMLCMPASVFVLYSYPMFKASATAFDLESAIIGEASVDEYTAASAISFDDKEVFPPTGVKVRSVKVYGSSRIDQVIYIAASVFAHVGGSLSDVLDIATIDLGHSDDVEIIDVEADGLEATVEGRRIYLGRASYLRRNSFVPLRDADDEEIENGGEICIMYMTVGDEVAAKIYVQYHIDPDFEFILKQLYSAGVCVGIKTADPNIDDRMLGLRIKLDKYPVKVLKCKTTDESTETKPRVDSGIVSKSSVKALLQTLAICDKVQHITKTGIVIKLFAILIGILLSAFLLALGLSASVISLYVALFQLFWILPMVIISKLFIN